MRVDDHARSDAEGVAQHNVRGLSGDTAERQNLVHRSRYLAAVFIDDSPARGLNIPCLVPEESSRVNVLFELVLRNRDKIRRAAIFAKQIGGNDIDAGVGALCR